MSRRTQYYVSAVTDKAIKTALQRDLDSINQLLANKNKTKEQLASLSQQIWTLDKKLQDSSLNQHTYDKFAKDLPSLHYMCALQHRVKFDDKSLLPDEKKAIWQRMISHLECSARYHHIPAIKILLQSPKYQKDNRYEQYRKDLIFHHLNTIEQNKNYSSKDYAEFDKALINSNYSTHHYFLEECLLTPQGEKAGFLLLQQAIKNSHEKSYHLIFSLLRKVADYDYGKKARTRFYTNVVELLEGLKPSDLQKQPGKHFFNFCVKNKNKIAKVLEKYGSEKLAKSLQNQAILTILYTPRNPLTRTKPSYKKGRSNIYKLYNELQSPHLKNVVKNALDQHEPSAPKQQKIQARKAYKPRQPTAQVAKPQTQGRTRSNSDTGLRVRFINRGVQQKNGIQKTESELNRLLNLSNPNQQDLQAISNQLSKLERLVDHHSSNNSYRYKKLAKVAKQHLMFANNMHERFKKDNSEWHGKTFDKHLEAAIDLGSTEAMEYKLSLFDKSTEPRFLRDLHEPLIEHYLNTLTSEQATDEQTLINLENILSNTIPRIAEYFLESRLDELQTRTQALKLGFKLLERSVKNDNTRIFNNTFRQLRGALVEKNAFYSQVIDLLSSLTDENMKSVTGKSLLKFCKNNKAEIYTALKALSDRKLIAKLKCPAIIDVLYHKRHGVLGTKPSVKRCDTKIAKLYRQVYIVATPSERNMIEAQLKRHEAPDTYNFEPAAKPKRFCFFSTTTAPKHSARSMRKPAAPQATTDRGIQLLKRPYITFS